MASKTTVTIQDTINYNAAFIVQRPQTGVGGTPLQPALTAANYAMATILAPPFIWEWNRVVSVAAITTIAGQSDYDVDIEDFGFLEKATLVISGAPANTPPNYELEKFGLLSKDGEQNRPQKICVLSDDNDGIITFRLFPAPDDIYTIDLDYQKAPVQITTLGSTTWAPIPDKMQFLYEGCMLAKMQMMYNQQLALSNLEIFFRQLVGAAEGLTETQKAIFLEDALRPIRMRQQELTGVQQGKASRL